MSRIVPALPQTVPSAHQPPHQFSRHLEIPRTPNELYRSRFVPIGCIVLPSHAVTLSANRYSSELEWNEEFPETLTSASSGIGKILKFLSFIGYVSAVYKIHVTYQLPTGSEQREQCVVARVHVLAWDQRGPRIPAGVLEHIQKDTRTLLDHVDISPELWRGRHPELCEKMPFDRWATPVRESLFYMFNTLPSPDPIPDMIPDEGYARDSLSSLLGSDPLPGLQTVLYRYQRRAAAAMVRREYAPCKQVDPRVEPRRSPDGTSYHYNPVDMTIWKEPYHYDATRGGILAESMGLGKTLICIAVILSTRGDLSQTPPFNLHTYARPRRHKTSLMAMAASAATRHSVPWKRVFYNHKEATGEEMTRCIDCLENQETPTYLTPSLWHLNTRRSSDPDDTGKIMHLSSATIIVSPCSLIHQWREEFRKHVKHDALRVLSLVSPTSELPHISELLKYDVVLFGRRRFERAINSDPVSPIRRIHWLRIIIDEGHSFAATDSQAVRLATQIITADRRWIVSGTPAKDLLGVEVEHGAMVATGPESKLADHETYRASSLQRRMHFDTNQEMNSGAVKSIGLLAAGFLGMQPWANNGYTNVLADDKSVQWDDVVYRHEDDNRRTYSAFSTCMRQTLENLVVKTRPEDVEKDLCLPPLSHETIKLEPCLFDKLTANLFVLHYTSNTVLSERQDQDYLFHKKNVHHLRLLTTNLHHSSFCWLGFRHADIAKTLEFAQEYLDKKDTLCSEDDRHTLQQTMEAAQTALANQGWNHLSQTQDIGVFARDWPSDGGNAWAYPGCEQPPKLMMTGLTQAITAQKYLNTRLGLDSPLAGFEDEGRSAVIDALAKGAEVGHTTRATPRRKKMAAPGVPSSMTEQDVMGSRRLSALGATAHNSRKMGRSRRDQVVGGGSAKNTDWDTPGGAVAADPPSKAPSRGKRKRRMSYDESMVDLSPDSDLGRTQVVGTTSSKLSYLVSRVLELHKEEKILIFYDADYIAYCTSQALDLFNVKHRIYGAGTATQRSTYLELFKAHPAHRVLIMNIHQAAHGLDLSAASRVFFVNPAFRPDIEAQAVKRAHRIGQTRPVHVETLVLAGTVEEAMHDRASKMTQGQHLAAKSLAEDVGIRGILQSARVLPIAEHELSGEGQMARLHKSEQLFGRPGRDTRDSQSGLEKESFDGPQGAMD